MRTARLQIIIATLALCALLHAGVASVAARLSDDPATGGATITNRAEATYEDELGATFATVSPTITLKVLNVSTLIVTPDETESSATVGPRETVTRLFRICNTGNTTDLYNITHAAATAPATITALYFDNDASGTLTNADALIHLNETLSPRVPQSSCIGVLAVINTNDFSPQSLLTINLTAHSNVTADVNGSGEDIGTIINNVGNGPRLTAPDTPSLPPTKLVNGNAQAVVTLGAPFTYDIAFRNNGDTIARGVRLVDDLPAGIEYIAGSLRLNERNLSDAEDTDEGFVRAPRVEVHIAEVASQEIVRVTFKARMNGNAPSGVGLVNTANISGLNFTSAQSSSAIVVVDPFGTVFAGRSGGAAAIAGAQVEILTDQSSDNHLQIPPNVGFTPNTGNVNPYNTDAQGHFSFALTPEQLGALNSPARYFIRVTAPGYVTRMLEILARPTADGLFALTVRSLDGQQLARAGSFELVNENVEIVNMAAVALNIPMFEQHGLEITKSADRARAEIGDVINYRVEIHNPTAATINNVNVHDRLPDSFHYAAGTARLTSGNSPERSIEPETQNDELVFRIGEIAPGQTARLIYRVRVGANAHEGEQQNTATGEGIFPTGEHSQTSPARATVIVGGGVFSTRQMILGRVFEDTNRNGKFDEDDRPMAGVRLYLNSGQSVTTDSEGLYNFPSLGNGSEVIALDPISIPTGYALTDGGTRAGKSWTRLLRTPVGGGALLRQNFALISTDDDTPAHLRSATPSASNNLTTEHSTATTERGKATTERSKTTSQTSNASSNKQLDASGNAQLVKASDAASNDAQPNAAGTYELASTETIEAVAPGIVKILSPHPDSVVMSPAMQLEARVALKWTVKLEVNGKVVSDQSIGTSRLDQKNGVATFTFVGIDLRPGANTVRVTPVDEAGATGKTEEFTVMGRGPVRRLEIVSEKTEVQAGGRDQTLMHVRAFDQWNNPAADDQIAIETSAGQLFRLDEQTFETRGNKSNASASGNQQGATNQTSTLQAGQMSATDGLNVENQAHNELTMTLDGGEATLRFIASGAPGTAKLHALMGQTEAKAELRITPEMRPTILVGLAELSIGNAPEIALRGEEGKYRSRLSFYYNGRLWANNLFTLAYDSQRPINRASGRGDRVFQLDPLDRVYPLFGDSSVRTEAAQSNSKLYARLDHDRSYAMFGDFTADMDDLSLMGYARKLTGVKLHLENSEGDFVTVTGARPDTSFARDVFPAGGLSILRLSHTDLLPGSESVAIEVRDRRNPELILSREVLIRSVDYNLDATTGELFFLRYISSFDYALNLVQLVVTYEHRADDMKSAIYTARARKNFAGLGLRLGFSSIMQRQADFGSFVLGGVDVQKSLPNRGMLNFAWSRSQGEIMGGGNFFESGSTGYGAHNGNAYRLELDQPLPFYDAVVRARFANSSEGFLNPFGATVTPGARRGELALELKPRASSQLRLAYTNERNKTATVDNSRTTLSAAWDQLVSERVRFHVGFDHRDFTDDLSDRKTSSNLVTAAAEIKATDKLEFSAKREQNLGEADPTYPTQTTLAATYQVNNWTKIFLTQRLASAPIMPINDVSQAGFASSSARHETAIGVETRFGKYTSMTGRYQLENGISGADSFAVIGLQNRLPITKELQLELGLERGFHMAGNGESFDSATVGFGWQPTANFRASARYEFRDRGGIGQLAMLGAAGRLRGGLTALARLQMSSARFGGRKSATLDGMIALALRPLESDRVGLLFSYNHKSLELDGANGLEPTRDRLDSLSTDGYYQATKALELYGRFALRFNANGQSDLAFVSTLSYLAQARAQYRLSQRLDWAGEARFLIQPSSGTSRTVFGTELGYWMMPDLRLGLGYNFSVAGEPAGGRLIPARRGFYFTMSSKLSNLFDLFGTSSAGLAGTNSNATEQSSDAATAPPTTQTSTEPKP
jgi:uncharacterized repeat protein (TIGR01451 family)